MGCCGLSVSHILRLFAPDTVLWTLSGEWTFLGTYISWFLLFAGQRWLTKRTLDVFYSAAMLCATIVASPLVPTGSDTVFLVMMRSTLSLLNIDVRSAGCWNIAITLVRIASSIFGDGTELNEVLRWEVWFDGIIVSCVWLLRWAVMVQIRAHTQMTSVRGEFDALHSLLNTLCDAVVELDSNYRFRHDSPQLAMLLINSSPTSLKGMEFAALLYSSDDKTGFDRYIRRVDAGTSTIADVYHARLRGSLGEGVHVELFRISYCDDDGEPFHIVGVRETTDVPGLMRSSTESTPPVAPNAETSSNPTQDSIEFDDEPRAMVVGFDAISFTILSCSEPLRALLGHTPLGTSIHRWLHGATKQGFLDRFCSHVNEVTYIDDAPAGIDLGLLHFHIKAPGATRQRLKMTASCYATVMVAGESENTIGANLHHTAHDEDAQTVNDEGSQFVVAFLELRGVHNVQRGTSGSASSSSSISGRGGAGMPSGGTGGGRFAEDGGGAECADSGHSGAGSWRSSGGGAGAGGSGNAGGWYPAGTSGDHGRATHLGTGSRHGNGGLGSGGGGSGYAGDCFPAVIGQTFSGVAKSNDHGDFMV
eukprot:NODE_4251_length_1914_cov_5.764969.p1 GENE.NODE_4251_length_1914_cov_5.764969~~NODE_4251_length_1914_cov_5.764969.p1  ORF type:complete len:590 (+),score=109.30 NODE_4251_length_1914_cov_5.764969:3-1772(+)